MKVLIPFFFFSFLSLNAQGLNDHQLDSLYNSFLRMHGITSESDKPIAEPEKNKCGFVTLSQIRFNFERFSQEKQQLLKNLLNRPTRDTSMVSPSGRFRVHFNLAGVEKPNYNSSLSTIQNAEEVGKAIDSVYNFEVNFLGYPAAPSDNGEGGDNLYDIYITSANGNYGFTDPELSLGNHKYTSHMQIHYSFLGQFYTHGLDAMRVTLAHEYHHAIQVGNYTLDGIDQDAFFYEITSTSMEEFVYDDVNDYYGYMLTYFNNTSVPFINTRGYELALWNIFLRDKFGYDIIKRQWQVLPQTRALNAINTSLNENGLNFKDALHEFGVWTFFTNYRAKSGKYFEEGLKYPIAKSITTIFFQSPDEEIIVNTKPVVNSYITFINRGETPDDSLILLVTNGDYVNGVSNPNGNYSLNYKLYDYAAPGSKRLNEHFSYYFSLDVDVRQDWNHSEFLNNELIGEHTFAAEYDYAFPSPFVYDKNTFIFIPVKNPESDNVDVNVYTSSMELVCSAYLNLTVKDGQAGIIWNSPLDNSNRRLASGVYIYAIKSGDKTSVGKLVIFNE